jgi:16S rRNA (guanine527-N7)-methyltransferase
MAALSPAEAGALLGVSRETLERFAAYLDLLERWQRRINLVGNATLADPWRRHILDCGQLWRSWPARAERSVDLGSGAGLPGIVLAIMGAPEMRLVESDQRKAAFLREAARACGVKVIVHAERIEALPPLAADLVTSRALAPLGELLRYAEPHLRPDGSCLFLKGRNAMSELTEAARTWTIDASWTQSLSDPDGRVLILKDIRRA